MKVVRVAMLADDYAVVHLRPSWLARLFGAKDVMCELVYLPHGYRADEKSLYLSGSGWHCKRTHKHIGYMRHSSLLEYALQFQPLQVQGDIPSARLLEGQE